MAGRHGPLRAVFLCAALLLAPAVAAAQAPPAPPAIDFAAELEAVEAQLFVTPDDPQTQFTRGMLLAELGRHLEAADVFRRMLARDPGLLRPRLELGRVLMLAQDYHGARYNFEQVLAHELPEGVRRNVMMVLARIREQLPQFTASLDIVYDNNPSQATSVEEVEIDGLRFRLNDDARANTSTGVRLLLDGRVPLPGSPLWFVRGVAEHVDYDGKAFDFSYLQLAGGRHLKFAEHTLTLEIGHHWARYQQQRLYDGLDWRLSDYRPLRPDLSLELALAGMRLDYPVTPFRDGWQHLAEARLVYAVRPDSRWELNLGYIDNGAEEAAYAFRQSQLGLRRVDEWSGGWITGVRLQGGRARYQDADPFFRETRRDREARLEIDVLNRRLRIWKLTPRLHLGVVDHRSSIDFYAYRRGYFRLGMTGEF